MTIAETFDTCYAVDQDTGCWNWLRARKGKDAAKGGGYGCFSLGRKTVGAHRFAYERNKGRIPKGLQVMHKCHNTLCVNPEHLMPGTNLENLEHSARDLRRPHKLTPEAILDIKVSVRSGVLQRVLANKYGIAQGDISHIVNGHYWKHIAP